MNDEPLSSEEQGKIIFFFVSMIPLMLFGVGIVFVGIFLFCTHLTRKHKSTSPLEGAINSFRVVALIASAASWVALGAELKSHDYDEYFPWYEDDYVIVLLIAAFSSMIYFILANFLFLEPIRRHREWVSKNGLFSSKNSSLEATNSEALSSIVKSEKLASSSVADELIKWTKLRDDGLVSEEEYQNARNKLLSAI